MQVAEQAEAAAPRAVEEGLAQARRLVLGRFADSGSIAGAEAPRRLARPRRRAAGTPGACRAPPRGARRRRSKASASSRLGSAASWPR